MGDDTTNDNNIIQIGSAKTGGTKAPQTPVADVPATKTFNIVMRDGETFTAAGYLGYSPYYVAVGSDTGEVLFWAPTELVKTVTAE